MAKTAEKAAEIAGERAYRGRLAAFGLEDRMVRTEGTDESHPADLDQARAEFHHFAIARQVVGALAFDLDRRIARRHLLDAAGKGREERHNRIGRASLIAPGHNAAFGVISIPFLTPANREAIELAAVHHERDGFGCFAKCDR